MDNAITLIFLKSKSSKFSFKIRSCINNMLIAITTILTFLCICVLIEFLHHNVSNCWWSRISQHSPFIQKSAESVVNHIIFLKLLLSNQYRHQLSLLVLSQDYWCYINKIMQLSKICKFVNQFRANLLSKLMSYPYILYIRLFAV